MALRNLFLGNPSRRAAGDFYRSLVAQSRSPEFYTSGGVPDTLDGRFDLVALHVALVLARLKKAQRPFDQLAQSLFDEMVANLDSGLREEGVGDMGVGTRMKKLVSAFYGRAQAYESALDQSGDDQLIDALERNLFRGFEPAAPAETLLAMAAYVRGQHHHLLAQPDSELEKGRISFRSFEGLA